MKFRVLPATDFANITTKRKAEQWLLLSKMERSYAPFSYEPTRRNLPSVLQAGLPLFGQFAPDEYTKTRSHIEKACKRGEAEAKANLAVCDALAEFVQENSVRAAHEPISSVRIGEFEKISYTSPLTMNYQGKPYLIFADFRRGGGLTKDACEFVFSVNHHFIVEQDAYFEGVGLMVLQFGIADENKRVVRPVVFDGKPRYSIDELEDMVRTTNALWSSMQIRRKKAS